MIKPFCIFSLLVGLTACNPQIEQSLEPRAKTQSLQTQPYAQTVQTEPQGESFTQIPPDRPVIRLTITPDDQDLTAHYVLPNAQVEFAFEPYNAPSRLGNWHMRPDFTFDGKTVRRIDGGAFSTFEIALSPETRFTNRRYVVLDPIGEGHSLFLPAFASINQAVQMSFDGFDDTAIVRIAGRNARPQGLALDVDPAFNRLIYIGASENSFGDSLIAGDDVPNWLKAQIETDLQNLVSTLTQRFGRAPKAPPTVMASSRADFESRGWKGGALEDGVIALRFRGLDLSKADRELSRSITGLIGHEATHLWIGQLFPNLQNAEQSWAHEGTSEYIATRLNSTESELLQIANDAYNRCMVGLGPRTLNDPSDMIQGADAYDCGFVVSLLAELTAQKNTGADILDIWNNVFDAASSEGYQPEDFIRAAQHFGGADFDAATQYFFDSALPRDPASRSAGLIALGITFTQGDPADMPARKINQKWLMPILASECTGRFGYHDDGEFYRLDTDDHCGNALAGGSTIDHVGPYNFIKEPYAAYQYAQAICTAKAQLIFTQTNGVPLAPLTCTAQIESALNAGLDFTALPALPNLTR